MALSVPYLYTSDTTYLSKLLPAALLEFCYLPWAQSQIQGCDLWCQWQIMNSLSQLSSGWTTDCFTHWGVNIYLKKKKYTDGIMRDTSMCLLCWKFDYNLHFLTCKCCLSRFDPPRTEALHYFFSPSSIDIANIIDWLIYVAEYVDLLLIKAFLFKVNRDWTFIQSVLTS